MSDIDFGLRRAVADGLKANVKHFMQQLLTNEELHAECVAAGPFSFRRQFVKEMGPFFANNRSGCDDLADMVYRFAETHWQERHPGLDPNKWLDGYAPPSPLTEKEIDDAWEVEIGSSESAMALMYEGSARTRKGGDLGSKRKT